MSNIKIHKQAGFTLVEIAIVLVIIGLLLGGILQGQELINSARVRNMADQNASVQAAYYGFIDRYRAVPGDMNNDEACAKIGSNNLSNCDASSTNRRGNGRVDSGSYEEASDLWAHLSAANFIVGSYEGGATSNPEYLVTGIAPRNVFEGRTILWRTSAYEIGSGTASERLGFVLGRLTPVNVLSQLDTKVDDGRPDSGVLRATSSGNGNNVGVQESNCITSASTGAGANSSSSSTWNINGESQDCNGIYLY